MKTVANNVCIPASNNEKEEDEDDNDWVCGTGTFPPPPPTPMLTLSSPEQRLPSFPCRTLPCRRSAASHRLKNIPVIAISILTIIALCVFFILTPYYHEPHSNASKLNNIPSATIKNTVCPLSHLVNNTHCWMKERTRLQPHNSTIFTYYCNKLGDASSSILFCIFDSNKCQQGRYPCLEILEVYFPLVYLELRSQLSWFNFNLKHRVDARADNTDENLHQLEPTTQIVESRYPFRI